MEQGVTDGLHCKVSDKEETTEAPLIVFLEFLSLSGEE